MTETLTFRFLKDKQRKIRAGFPETVGLRVHRSISWIGRADDARFVFLWISFNAAYADESEFQSVGPSERASFLDYFAKLTALDSEKKIYKAIWQKFSGPIRTLMENRYVFNPFWQHHNGIGGFDDWEARFTASSRVFVDFREELTRDFH